MMTLFGEVIPMRRGYERSQMSHHLRRQLLLAADPQCPECDGEGFVSYTSQQHRDGYVDVRCKCVEWNDERETTEHGV